MEIRIERGSSLPLFQQIVDQLERLLASGRVAGGTRLPPSRVLARRLGVNRNTVVAAYRELRSRGRATARTGRGTFLGRPAEQEPALTAPLRWEAILSRGPEERVLAETVEPPSAAEGEASAPLAGNYPPEDLLPVEEFRRALDRALRQGGPRLLAYGSPMGHPPLREWIAGEMARRGAAVPPGQIVITTGSQQAIDLAARALVSPGETVLVEEPGFPLAIAAFQAHGARVEGIPADGEGILPDVLAQALERRRPKLLYLIPDFHNPTGVCLSAGRRAEVLELAGRHGTAVLEDDSAGSLRFAGEALPPLRGLDRSGGTLYLSTFSKVLLPGVRVGWICAPEPIRDRIAALKEVTDCATSLLLQAALARFCSEGGLERHRRRVRRIYRERRDEMLGALRRWFPPGVAWTEPQGGLVLWVTLPEGCDARELLPEARRRGVTFQPAEPFFAGAPRHNHLRLRFAGVPPAPLREGVRALGEILAARLEQRGAARPTQRGEAVPLV